MSVDGVFNPIDIAVSGLRAHGREIEVISSNIANAQTTDAGNGQPYRRLEAIFRSQGEGVSGVTVDETAEDMSPLEQVFDPSDARANASGYVSMPNVNIPIEMMNLNLATRSYQANAAMLKRYERLVETTLELLR